MQESRFCNPGDRRVPRHNVYRDGKLHVCDRMCETCIFRPGNLMHLEPGRVEGMVRDALVDQSVIVCHKTLAKEPKQNAACRGFVDRYGRQVAAIVLARQAQVIQFIEPPTTEDLRREYQSKNREAHARGQRSRRR